MGTGDHAGSAQVAQGDVVSADEAQLMSLGQAGAQEAGQEAQLLIAPGVAADVVALHHGVQDHELLLGIVGSHVLQTGALAAAQTDDEVAVAAVGVAGDEPLILGVILGLGIYPLDAHGALGILHAVEQRVVKGLVAQTAGGEHHGDLGSGAAGIAGIAGVTAGGAGVVRGLAAGRQGHHHAGRQQQGQPLFHSCKFHFGSSLHTCTFRCEPPFYRRQDQ